METDQDYGKRVLLAAKDAGKLDELAERIANAGVTRLRDDTAGVPR
jgi:hypothetical protein